MRTPRPKKLRGEAFGAEWLNQPRAQRPSSAKKSSIRSSSCTPFAISISGIGGPLPIPVTSGGYHPARARQSHPLNKLYTERNRKWFSRLRSLRTTPHPHEHL